MQLKTWLLAVECASTYNYLFKQKYRRKDGLRASEALQNYHKIPPAPWWIATSEQLAYHSYLAPLAWQVSDEQQWKEKIF